MKLLRPLAFFVLLTIPCGARISETMAELKLRYGAPIDVDGEPESPTSRWTFQERNYVIVVTLRNNRSVSEEFTRRDRRDFTLEEVRGLLEENATPGGAWSQVSGKRWRQGDRVATWFERAVLVQGE